MKVVSATEDFEIIAFGNHGLCDVVDLFWLLGLASTLTEYHIGLDVKPCSLVHIPLDSNKTSLLRMLQIVPMPLGNLPIDCLLDPHNFINKSVPIVVHHVECKPVLGVDHPYEQKAICLKFVERDFQDGLVCKSFVCDRHSSGGIGGRKLPWRVTGDHVKKSTRVLLLSLS